MKLTRRFATVMSGLVEGGVSMTSLSAGAWKSSNMKKTNTFRFKSWFVIFLHVKGVPPMP